MHALWIPSWPHILPISKNSSLYFLCFWINFLCIQWIGSYDIQGEEFVICFSCQHYRVKNIWNALFCVLFFPLFHKTMSRHMPHSLVICAFKRNYRSGRAHLVILYSLQHWFEWMTNECALKTIIFAIRYLLHLSNYA